MLVQMNQAAPPPHYGDYKYAPPPPSHHHHHHSHHAHHGLLPPEPQHDDFGEPDHNNGYAHAAHHHAHFAHNHPWTTGHGLAQFGAAFGSHHDYDDQDHDDHLDQDDEDDDSNNNPVNASSGIQSSGSRRSKSGTSGATNASSSKKETFMCPEVHCGKTFPRSFALRRHMRIHTGTKPYACDFDGCTQRFNTSGNLSRHKRIHSGERPYPCVFASCGKRFNTSTKLKRHMRIHFPDGQSLFHCVQQACVFACDNYKEYVHHQRQHGNPAYAAPPTPTHHDTTDENVDRSNLPAKAKTAKTAKTAKSAKTKTKKNAASDKIPQPRVSKASSAMAAATTAVLRGDFPAPPSAHGFDTSPSSSAASGLSLLMKEARDLDAEYSAAFDRSGANSRLLDRPRLPFPTGAFPSDSISGASPMNLASAFGNAYAPANAATNNAARYYDHTSSSSTSYLRGDTGYGHHQPQQPHYLQAHDGIHFPPLRPEDAPGDDDYDNDDATSPRHNSTHQGTHHHHNHHNHHAHRRGGDNDDGDAHGDDDAKYGGYGSVPHAPGPEFTGEELSAVLELMKDS